MCGEKTLYSGIRLVVLGSPPRVRGKGEQTARPHYHMRITPACAGKRRLSAKTASRSRDHPRVCGEKLVQFVHFRCPKGSPPRVRGKDPDAERGCERGGITPACAGKRSARSAACLAGKDHPRVCGEKLHSLSPQLCVHGSPPRVRGKVDAATLTLKARGITPACAGKRLLPCCFWRLHRDHPRVCGEKRTRQAVWTQCGGSPPRVRGKGCVIHFSCPPYGITPACAGKRAAAAPEASGHQDHPRVCGEKFDNPKIDNSQLGSPPRVRGKV